MDGNSPAPIDGKHPIIFTLSTILLVVQDFAGPSTVSGADPLSLRPFGMCMTLLWFLAESWLDVVVSRPAGRDLTHLTTARWKWLKHMWTLETPNVWPICFYIIYIYKIKNIPIVFWQNKPRVLIIPMTGAQSTGLEIKPNYMGQNLKTFKLLSFWFQIWYILNLVGLFIPVKA